MEKENATRLCTIMVVLIFLIPVSSLVVQGEGPLPYLSLTNSNSKQQSQQQSTPDSPSPTEEDTEDSSGSDSSPNGDDSLPSSFPVQNMLSDASDHILPNMRFKNRFFELLRLLQSILDSIRDSWDREANDSVPPDNNTENPPPYANVTDAANESETPPEGTPDPINSSYHYPRLSLGTFWLQDWVTKPGFGLDWLYQFQEVYGVTPSEKILEVKQRAIEDGHREWAEHTIFIQNDCLLSARDLISPPEEWMKGYARNNIGSAKDLAVYYNKLLGCDWYLRDINGSKIPVWGDEDFALDTTPDCDLGLWDGTLTYQGQQYCIGSTVGLTYIEWLAGPFSDNVLRGSLFHEAYDGLQTEDGHPWYWPLYYRGYIPDPKHDGQGFPRHRDFEEYCNDTWSHYYTDFLQPLQDEFIIRMNGHNLRWYFEGEENKYPLTQETFTACKLEQYGGWGGWPHWDLPMWIRVYKAVEYFNHPLSENSDDPEFDNRQGWDVTTIQCNAHYAWDSEKIDRWKRLALASTLMGDGLCDAYAYLEDYYFTKYLRQGNTEYAPRGIPQMSFQLGGALGDYHLYNYYPDYPLYYRQFYNNETEKTYTVALNVWNFPINNIPAQDGVWFEGDWPYGTYEPLLFE